MNRIATLAKTPVEDLVAPVADAREALAKAAAGVVGLSDLAALVHRIAEAQAVADLRVRVARLAEQGRSATQIREMLVDVLVAGADDTWSGRGNDLRRVTYDAVRNEVRDLIYALEEWA